MDSELRFYIVLIGLMSTIMIIYSIYIIFDEKKKRKYYKSKIYYDKEWDMYNTMVKKQKRVIFFKRLELVWLTLLVKIKRFFK